MSSELSTCLGSDRRLRRGRVRIINECIYQRRILHSDEKLGTSRVHSKRHMFLLASSPSLMSVAQLTKSGIENK